MQESGLLVVNPCEMPYRQNLSPEGPNTQPDTSAAKTKQKKPQRSYEAPKNRDPQIDSE